MKKYQMTHEEYAVSPLTISPNHAGWASPLLVKLLDGKSIARNTFCSHEDNGLRFYCDLFSQWKKASEYVIQKIQREKTFVIRVEKMSEKLAVQLVDIVRSTEKEDLSQWTNAALARFLLQTHSILADLCSYGYIPVLVDIVFGKYTYCLKGIITKAIERKKNMTLSVPEVLHVLTSPLQRIPSRQARIDFLKLVLQIKNPKKFSQKERAALNVYYTKWFWVGFGQLGPRLTKEQLAHDCMIAAKNRVNTKKELYELIHSSSTLAKEQRQLVSLLALSSAEQYLFHVARNFTYLKGLRMEVSFGVCAQWERVLREMEGRFGVPKALLYYCSVSELVRWLVKGKSVSLYLLKERKKYCVWVQMAKMKERIYIGGKAHAYIRIHAEKKKQNFVNLLVVHGTVASPGYAKGVVKIVNKVSEIEKVEEGDILVSIATNPSLLPAMKKAAAFVTEEGGITSHAAIVAREMEKPCIIGTKVATKVFKDGDTVELDTKTGDIQKVS